MTTKKMGTKAGREKMRARVKSGRKTRAIERAAKVTKADMIAEELVLLDLRDAPKEEVALAREPRLGLQAGSVCIVTGPGASGKSLAIQSMALDVVHGAPIWGVYPWKRGRVLHLDYEQGQLTTVNRYRRLARGRGMELSDLKPGELTLAPHPPIYLDRTGGISMLECALEGHALAIVDSLVCTLPGSDESSSALARAVTRLAAASAATGCAIVVAHHARKAILAPPSSMRGSSAIFDSAGSVLVFQADAGAFAVSHEKNRSAGTVEPSFKLELEDVPKPRAPQWGLRVKHSYLPGDAPQ